MTNPAIAHRQSIEREIVRLMAHEAISKGYSITVFDGEENAITKSTDTTEIMKHIMTTDEDRLSFYRPDNTFAGYVYLIYGNDGWDVISDYTLNDEMNVILAPAESYATEAEHQDAMNDFNYVGSRHHY